MFNELRGKSNPVLFTLSLRAIFSNKGLLFIIIIIIIIHSAVHCCAMTAFVFFFFLLCTVAPEEILDRKVAVGIRHADHVAPSIRKSWQSLR
jgi:hypothetical protein